MITPSFWHNKRVFVTGHTGFKGSWLSLWLHQLGAIVQGYSLPAPSSPSLFEEAELAHLIASDLGDVRDTTQLTCALARFKPDIVFHLAAQSLVRLSYESPMETYSTNIMGCVSLFEAVRQVSGIKAVINVTSDKCYDNREWVWGYREEEAMGGFDPYSSSKGCAELITASYRQSFFHPDTYPNHRCAIASARAGNVIGGGDWAHDRLIPDLLHAYSNKTPVNIRNPNAIRPWQHVLEPLSGYMTLAERLYTQGMDYAQAWNFGPHDTETQAVHWIADKLAALWGDGASWQTEPAPQPHEAHYLKLDCSKARMTLGWTPRWSLETSLHRIVAWHKAWLDKANMQDYTLSEINDYMQTGDNDHVNR